VNRLYHWADGVAPEQRLKKRLRARAACERRKARRLEEVRE